MNADSTLSSVVFPVPVPPETRMLSFGAHGGVEHASPSRAVIVPKSDQVVDRVRACARTSG